MIKLRKMKMHDRTMICNLYTGGRGGVGYISPQPCWLICCHFIAAYLAKLRIHIVEILPTRGPS